MNDIDFGRSFVRFTSTRVNHTPRLHLDAACTIVPKSGEARQYFLSAPCIGEEMYVREKLIHVPVFEVVFIVLPGKEFAMINLAASAAKDLHTYHRVGEAMPTRSGTPSTVTEFDARITRCARVTPIRTYADFREAHLGDRVINVRTTYDDTDTGERFIVDYPAKTTNIARGKEAWQVDAGPILVPSERRSGELEVSRFNLAFIVFNAFDNGEIVVREPTAVGESEQSGKTNHYARLFTPKLRHELFDAR